MSVCTYSVTEAAVGGKHRVFLNYLSYFDCYCCHPSVLSRQWFVPWSSILCCALLGAAEDPILALQSLPHLLLVKTVDREGAGFADFCFQWSLFSTSYVDRFFSPLLNVNAKITNIHTSKHAVCTQSFHRHSFLFKCLSCE